MQVPFLPATLQAWHEGIDELPQHTPLTQVAPLTQSAVDRQSWEMGRPTQAPLLQIRLPLHVEPSAAFPVVRHVCVPEAQEYVPTVQVAFEQAPPALQACCLHTPPLQTCEPPHGRCRSPWRSSKSPGGC